MIIRNGKSAMGWRLDDMNANMEGGIGMLMNPFAIVPKEENADKIVKAFEYLEEYLQGTSQEAAPAEDWARKFRQKVEALIGESS